MTDPTPEQRPHPGRWGSAPPDTGWRRIAALAALALFSAGCWAAWLGWDQEYYEVDGVTQGPYRPEQVIGCGACIVVASIVVFLYLRRPSTIPVVAAVAVVGFAIPWATQASTDSTGLWAVGLMFLLIGGGLGLVSVLAVVHLLRILLHSVRNNR
ncbi:hypothetical protein [Nocardia sp. NPDC051832]|uniref:hypothetical protein n=1 Tax=Nocardia sp. NPDC051832 TaxID=3155673 RepID=UPI0034416647